MAKLGGFYAWDEMDEACLREGAALKRSFHSTAVRGTPKRKAHVAGGPKNRQRRKAWLSTEETVAKPARKAKAQDDESVLVGIVRRWRERQVQS